MHVLAGTAAPLLAAGDELQLDDPLGAERHGHAAVRVLLGRRHENATAAFEGGGDFGSLHHLAKVRRADLLFSFGDQDEIDRRLLPRSPDGVQGGQKGGLRPLLVHRAAAHHDLAEPGLVHDRGVPRRRGPLGRVHLLDVVHEVEADGARRAGVQRGEHPRLPVGVNAGDLLEPGVARQPHHQVASLVHAAVLGGDRRLPNPFLKPLDALVVALRDLGADAGGRSWGGGGDGGSGGGGTGRPWQGNQGGQHDRHAEDKPTVRSGHGVLDLPEGRDASEKSRWCQRGRNILGSAGGKRQFRA